VEKRDRFVQFFAWRKKNRLLQALFISCAPLKCDHQGIGLWLRWLRGCIQTAREKEDDEGVRERTPTKFSIRHCGHFYWKITKKVI